MFPAGPTPKRSWAAWGCRALSLVYPKGQLPGVHGTPPRQSPSLLPLGQALDSVFLQLPSSLLWNHFVSNCCRRALSDANRWERRRDITFSEKCAYSCWVTTSVPNRGPRVFWHPKIFTRENKGKTAVSESLLRNRFKWSNEARSLSGTRPQHFSFLAADTRAKAPGQDPGWSQGKCAFLFQLWVGKAGEGNLLFQRARLRAGRLLGGGLASRPQPVPGDSARGQRGRALSSPASNVFY